MLAPPPTVTTTLPVVAPVGTDAMIAVALQLAGAATAPLNVTELPPCVEPKFVPVIVIGVPNPPDEGFKLVMLGKGSTVKDMALLATPPTVTTTLPVVAPAGTVTMMVASFQARADAVKPLKLTVLDPCVG